MVVYTIVAFLVSCAFTAILMPHVIKFCEQKNLYDRPNERKIHRLAVPRLGGILFMPAMLTGMIAAFVLLIFLNQNPPVLRLQRLCLLRACF